MSLGTTSRAHVTHHTSRDPLPTSDYTGRRLVIARHSTHRLVHAHPMWWTQDDLHGSHFRPEAFADLLDATMSPRSVFIGKFMIANVDLHLSVMNKLAGFDELLQMLSSRIGRLFIHYGYNLRTDTTDYLQFDCGGSGDSEVHLIGQTVGNDLFQLYYDWQINTINAEWASVLAAVGRLPQPLFVERGIGPLVPHGFACPYNQIIEISDNHMRETPMITSYETVYTPED
jgi:hypothetical protein